jgi:hypothetical protein
MNAEEQSSVESKMCAIFGNFSTSESSNSKHTHKHNSLQQVSSEKRPLQLLELAQLDEAKP